tara:strand:- start:4215 stop:4823 length:609 start_codon:yes stop_codon:yes gene_type:complete
MEQNRIESPKHENISDNSDIDEHNEPNVDNNLVQTILKEINNAGPNNSNESFQTTPQQMHAGIGNPANQPPEYYVQHPPIASGYMPPMMGQHGSPQQGPPQFENQQQYQQNPMYNMQPNLYNQQMMDIINSEESVFNKLTKHLKETVIFMLLFILLSCETTRSACANHIPKLGTDTNSLNMFGTTLLAVIFGIIFAGIKQFI